MRSRRAVISSEPRSCERVDQSILAGFVDRPLPSRYRAPMPIALRTLLGAAALAVGCAGAPPPTRQPSTPDPTTPHPSTPPPAVATPSSCLPPALHGPLVERRGKWNLYHPHAPGGDSLHFLEHLGAQPATDENRVLALRGDIPHPILDAQIQSFGVSFCGDGLPAPLSTLACLNAGVYSSGPGDPFAIATRIDELLGTKHMDTCFGVRVDITRPVYKF